MMRQGVSIDPTKEASMSFETIKRDVKICMFDQYGTVVDM